MSGSLSGRLFSRLSLPSVAAALAVGAALVLSASVRCSSYREDAPVRFVRHVEDAGGCSKVGDVAAAPQLPDSEVVGSIAVAARKINADTVVLASGERKGTAYRCEATSVAKKD